MTYTLILNFLNPIQVPNYAYMLKTDKMLPPPNLTVDAVDNLAFVSFPPSGAAGVDVVCYFIAFRRAFPSPGGISFGGRV